MLCLLSWMSSIDNWNYKKWKTMSGVVQSVWYECRFWIDYRKFFFLLGWAARSHKNHPKAMSANAANVLRWSWPSGGSCRRITIFTERFDHGWSLRNPQQCEKNHHVEKDRVSDDDVKIFCFQEIFALFLFCIHCLILSYSTLNFVH